MARRVFKIATLVSTALLVVVVLFALAATVSERHVSIGESFHIGIWNRGFDSRIVFFNDSDYGPYRGSIIGFADEEGNLHPPLVHQEGFGDTWGIYHRYFEWADAKLWTLAVGVWYPIAIFGALPLARLFIKFLRPEHGKHLGRGRDT